VYNVSLLWFDLTYYARSSEELKGRRGGEGRG